MERRQFFGLCIAITTVSCASRRPKPIPPALSLNSIGMLPILENPPSGGTAPFSLHQLPQPTSAYSPPPITPQLLGMAIGNAIKRSREENQRALANAISTIGFSAYNTINNEIESQLVERRMSLPRIASPSIAAEVRDGKFASAPKQFDAILDIQIQSAGYSTDKKLGFVPSLEVSLRLLYTKYAESVSYEIDYEIGSDPSDGSSNYFSIPSSLIIGNITDFEPKAATINSGMTLMCKLIVSQLLQDLTTRVKVG